MTLTTVSTTVLYCDVQTKTISSFYCNAFLSTVRRVPAVGVAKRLSLKTGPARPEHTIGYCVFTVQPKADGSQLNLPHRIKQKINKCVGKTDTNPQFAFQIAFPRGTDFTGFLHGGSKIRDLQSEISVRIES